MRRKVTVIGAGNVGANTAQKIAAKDTKRDPPDSDSRRETLCTQIVIDTFTAKINVKQPVRISPAQSSLVAALEYVRPRWMLFVDGENMTHRAQQLSSNENTSFPKRVSGGRIHSSGFRSIRCIAMQRILSEDEYVWGAAVRSYYFMSVPGDEPKRAENRGCPADNWVYCPGLFAEISNEDRRA